MPALDDYAPPAPLWLVVLASLRDLDTGGGVTCTMAQAEAARRMPGRFRRLPSVFTLCRRMSEDGMLRVARVVRMGNVTATFYAVTELGTEMFDEARAASVFALRLRLVVEGSTSKQRR